MIKKKDGWITNPNTSFMCLDITNLSSYIMLIWYVGDTMRYILPCNIMEKISWKKWKSKHGENCVPLTADPSLHVQLSLIRRDMPIQSQCCSWSSSSLCIQPNTDIIHSHTVTTTIICTSVSFILEYNPAANTQLNTYWPEGLMKNLKHKALLIRGGKAD